MGLTYMMKNYMVKQKAFKCRLNLLSSQGFCAVSCCLGTHVYPLYVVCVYSTPSLCCLYLTPSMVFIRISRYGVVCVFNPLFMRISLYVGAFSSMTYLDLSCNQGGLDPSGQPTCEGTAALALQMKLSLHMRVLRVAENSLGDADMLHIAYALHDMPQFQDLDVASNKIRTNGARALALAIISHSLFGDAKFVPCSVCCTYCCMCCVLCCALYSMPLLYCAYAFCSCCAVHEYHICTYNLRTLCHFAPLLAGPRPHSEQSLPGSLPRHHSKRPPPESVYQPRRPVQIGAGC
jgi:hypothetical protein